MAMMMAYERRLFEFFTVYFMETISISFELGHAAMARSSSAKAGLRLRVIGE